MCECDAQVSTRSPRRDVLCVSATFIEAGRYSAKVAISAISELQNFGFLQFPLLLEENQLIDEVSGMV